MTSRWTRRELLRSVGAGAAAWTAARGMPFAASAATARRPNIIFVMVDDMGYGDLGVYGQRHIQMPHLDRMAREGIRYTNCYAGSPVCAPARSVLMTGQHTGHTRVRNNTASVEGHGAVPCSGYSGGWRVPLQPEDTTVAEVLRGAGYVTGITGKWGLGEPGTAGVPTRKGFDEWLGFLNQSRAHSFYPEYIWHNEEKLHFEGNTGTREDFVNEAHYVHDAFTAFAHDFIQRHAGGNAPFFLYLPYTVPHSRFQIPDIEPYAAESDWPMQAKVYASMLTRCDRDMGKLFALLKQYRIDEETIVFFCSDNGAANRYEGLFDSSGPLRGGKRDMHEGGLRTPMVVRWPGRIGANTFSDDIWNFADVLPTCAELAGAAPPDDIDGVSVLQSLTGQPQPALRERPLYWEFERSSQFQQAARLGDWKALREAHDGPIALYNLADDIGETRDLAHENTDRVAWFENYFRTARTPSPNWPSPLDP